MMLIYFQRDYIRLFPFSSLFVLANFVSSINTSQTTGAPLGENSKYDSRSVFWNVDYNALVRNDPMYSKIGGLAQQRELETAGAAGTEKSLLKHFLNIVC